MKVFIKTIGCKLNQYEAENLMARFESSGFIPAENEACADLCIINTCTVTQKADYKSRNAVHSIIRNNPSAEIVVTGCYTRTDPEIFKKIQRVSVVEYDKRKIAKRYRAGEPSKNNINYKRSRPYVKIQDGCDEKCSYCKTRFARGAGVSYPVSGILEQMKELIERNCKELVIVGTNIGSYSDGSTDFVDLLERMTRLPGLGRIRLSSIEPTFCTDRLIDLIASTDKICRHLHIPMQSGSDLILKYMKRPYGSGEFIKMVDKIKYRLDGINIGTDIITGFPFETDKEFEKTLKVVDHCRFGYAHVFRFSRREKTEAYNLECQTDEKAKTSRSEVLRKISEKNKSEYRKKFPGKNLLCFIENEHKALSDNYIDIELNSARHNTGMIEKILIERVDGTKVFGI